MKKKEKLMFMTLCTFTMIQWLIRITTDNCRPNTAINQGSKTAEEKMLHFGNCVPCNMPVKNSKMEKNGTVISPGERSQARSQKMKEEGNMSMKDIGTRITNSGFCYNLHGGVLIYVFSGVKNFERRASIRSTWGNVTNLKEKTKVLYVVGNTPDSQIIKQVRAESEKFGDIVQGDFMDKYDKLINKSVMAFKWIQAFCKEAKLHVKTDDDIMFDVQKVLNLLSSRLDQPRQIMCYLFNRTSVVRTKGRKYYVSKDELSENVYPQYCNGWVYIFTRDIVDDMCLAMAETKMFKIEDVWTTGFVLRRIKDVNRLHLPMLYTRKLEHFPHKASVLHNVSPMDMRLYWTALEAMKDE